MISELQSLLLNASWRGIPTEFPAEKLNHIPQIHSIFLLIIINRLIYSDLFIAAAACIVAGIDRDGLAAAPVGIGSSVIGYISANPNPVVFTT